MGLTLISNIRPACLLTHPALLLFQPNPPNHWSKTGSFSQLFWKHAPETSSHRSIPGIFEVSRKLFLPLYLNSLVDN